MKKIDGSNWLFAPWRLMSYGDSYRHYVKRAENYEETFIVVRTSDKCYRVTRIKSYYTRYPANVIYVQSFRTWNEVNYYAIRVIR